MKHLCIIAFLITALQVSAYAWQPDSSLTHVKAKKAVTQTADTSSKQPAKIKVTHIPAPKHKSKQVDPMPVAHASVPATSICFPLTEDRQYHVYDFMILLDDKRVIDRYKPYFDKRRLKFSGYVWEEVLRDMLSDADPEISRYVVLRSERDKIMIKITKFQVMKTFPDHICHIFSNMVRFDEYLKKLDPSKMPGY